MEIFGLILLTLYFNLEGKKMFSGNKKIFPDGENENFINEYNQIIEWGDHRATLPLGQHS